LSLPASFSSSIVPLLLYLLLLAPLLPAIALGIGVDRKKRGNRTDRQGGDR
jgi:hypothetical protein